MYGCNVYEEAYALTLGYRLSELDEIISVIVSRRMLERGTYAHPDDYYIHPDIPPRRLLPVTPDSVVPWSTPSQSLLPNTLYRYTNRVTNENFEYSDEVLPVKDSDIGLLDAPLDSLVSVLKDMRLREDEVADRITPVDSSSVFEHFKEAEAFSNYLIRVCKLSKGDVRYLWVLLRNRGEGFTIKDALLDAGVTRDKAEFADDWSSHRFVK